MTDTVLATYGLTKRFDSKLAVDNVSLTVNDGDIYGFLGPNGAGKTTTLRMVLGLIRPTAGRVSLFGTDLAGAPLTLLRDVGSLIEGPSLYPQLSATNNLRIVQQLKGGGPAREIEEVLELVNLRDVARQPASSFSLGMKQRLAIAMALLGRPRFLVLDEPTNGLDPAGMREMRTLLRRLVDERAMTVLVSSHLLFEVQQIATRVGVIGDGRLLVESSVEDLRRRASGGLEITVSQPQAAAAFLSQRLNASVEWDGLDVVLVRGGVRPAEINTLLVGHDFQVSRLIEREPSLEEVFFDLTASTSTRDQGEPIHA